MRSPESRIGQAMRVHNAMLYHSEEGSPFRRFENLIESVLFSLTPLKVAG
jgi:hypothetical protein